jgi:hypothetical protein
MRILRYRPIRYAQGAALPALAIRIYLFYDDDKYRGICLPEGLYCIFLLLNIGLDKPLFIIRSDIR